MWVITHMVKNHHKYHEFRYMRISQNQWNRLGWVNYNRMAFTKSADFLSAEITLCKFTLDFCQKPRIFQNRGFFWSDKYFKNPVTADKKSAEMKHCSTMFDLRACQLLRQCVVGMMILNTSSAIWL